MMYEQNQECEYSDECRNCNNDIKCNRCVNNPFNFEMIDRYGEGQAHDRIGKGYFNYADNYEPL